MSEMSKSYHETSYVPSSHSGGSSKTHTSSSDSDADSSKVEVTSSLLARSWDLGVHPVCPRPEPARPGTRAFARKRVIQPEHIILGRNGEEPTRPTRVENGVQVLPVASAGTHSSRSRASHTETHDTRIRLDRQQELMTAMSARLDALSERSEAEHAATRAAEDLARRNACISQLLGVAVIMLLVILLLVLIIH